MEHGDPAGKSADEDPADANLGQECRDIPAYSRRDYCIVRCGTYGSRRPDTKKSVIQAEEDLGADVAQEKGKVHF